ncbi:hypothetical protein R6Z07F_004536 [Ovis aries]
MAVRDALGAEWDSEKVGECGMGAEGPDRAGLWDQLEEEREREGRLGGTRQTASPRRLAGARLLCRSGRLRPPQRLQLIHSLLAPLPALAPYPVKLEAPPTLSPGGRLRLPTSRLSPVSLTFDFSLGSRGDPGATAGKQPKEVAGVRPGRGRNETGRTRSLAPLLPGGAWHQQDLNPGRCVCQAMPGDWMEGIQHDEILCRRMVCGERGLGTKVAGPKRTVGCLPHLFSTWPFRLDERLPWTTKYTAAAPPAA